MFLLKWIGLSFESLLEQRTEGLMYAIKFSWALCESNFNKSTYKFLIKMQVIRTINSIFVVYARLLTANDDSYCPV